MRLIGQINDLSTTKATTEKITAYHKYHTLPIKNGKPLNSFKTPILEFFLEESLDLRHELVTT
jgi:hypothetical protein